MIMALMAGTLIILWWYGLTLGELLASQRPPPSSPSSSAFAVTEHLKFFAECTALGFYHLPGWVKVQGAVWWPAGTVNYRGQYVCETRSCGPGRSSGQRALESGF